MNGLAFPDQIHLDKIRADLWCGREYGRAAIMVGSGFSRNADRLSPSIPPFPLLQDLAVTMYGDLCPTKGSLSRDQEMRMAQKTFGTGVLRLAREYEAEFGRAALDELLLSVLPDNNYLPGRLHRLLLTLPWSDVFTTNYDTLLERTRAAIHERKYDLVQTVHDIPGRMKPRVVKLHGSFPSHRPFIITEDDYRLYPAHFAPFVNMVQQSIMENSFCLVGFSGDDPNFLYWSGWVRDNLKEAAPTIYLCGLLSLSHATRQVLQSRRIIPIDLSPLFPVNVWPDPDVRHSKALEWLFLNLMHGATPDLKGWPEPSKMVFEDPSQGLPAIPPGPQPLSGSGPHFPDPRTFKLEDFSGLRDAWRLSRQEYPGWVVAPKENRETVWRFTQHWIDRIFASVASMAFPDNLLLLYELNWRLEITLTPLFLNQVEKIAAVLNEINPFPHLATIEGAKFLPDPEKQHGDDWAEISKFWVELTFALAREAREDVDEKRFRHWMDRLRLVIQQQLEWQARWSYEEALFCLFRMDQTGLVQALQDWPDMPDQPFWESKRAALLAELGRISEAARIAEAALSKIRSRLQPYRTDYALLSQEGFVMMLFKAIGTSMHPFFLETGQRYRARWDKLDGFGCNPWREIELFTLALAARQPEAIPETETGKSFDPGEATFIRHMSPGLRIADFLPAFGLLRFYEEGGIPIRCGIVNLFSDEGATAAKWVSPFAPLWALAILLRTGQDKWIQENYDRVRLATITQGATERIYSLCSEGLRQSIESLSAIPGMIEGHLGRRLIPTLTELLSRLSFRLDAKAKATIFDFGVRLYNSPAVRGDTTLFKSSLPLLKRSIFAMSQEEIMSRIPILLSLQIPGESGFENVVHPDFWPEPIDYFDLRLATGGAVHDSMDWSTSISRLIRLTATGNPQLVRKRAAARLAGLQKHGLLTPLQQDEFAKVLWSETDPNTKLPSTTDFFGFAFMSLPEVNAGEAKRLVHSFLLGSEAPRMFSRTRLEDGKEQKTYNTGAMENRYVHELIGATKSLFPLAGENLIDWSTEESMVLLEKIAGWWQAEKSDLRASNSGQFFNAADQLRSQFAGIIGLMTKVFLPRMRNADVMHKELASKLLSEMEQSGFCILAAVPMELFIAPQRLGEVASKIRGGIISNKDSDAKEAMAGLFLWLAHAQRGGIAAPPDDLLGTLITKVKTRVQPALVDAFAQTAAIIRQMPSALEEPHIIELSVGLDYLLTETKFSDPFISEEKEGHRLIANSKAPFFRRYACALAFQIYCWCLREDKSIPTAILKWKEVAETDMLPEVRLEWES